jgi:RimJ/RimL family protein N-acetyltransferase
MTDGRRIPELCVPTVSRQPALILRPWRAADVPALAAEMSREYPTAGMWPRPGERPVRTVLSGTTEHRAGPAVQRDAARWLASQDRGWRDGDRLSFAVLTADDVGGYVLAGNVGLENREDAGQIGERETAEIGYWTAVAARGRGIAPAAVRAVTEWVFEAFAGTSLRQIMLVHDVRNPASCRVAEKAGYPFRELSRANPPHWFTDGHIHMRLGGWPGPAAGAQRGTTLPIRPRHNHRSTVSPVTCLTQRSSVVVSGSFSPATDSRAVRAASSAGHTTTPDRPVMDA